MSAKVTTSPLMTFATVRDGRMRTRNQDCVPGRWICRSSMTNVCRTRFNSAVRSPSAKSRRKVADRPSHVAVEQVEEGCGRRREALDAQRTVQEEGGDLGAADEVLKVGVGLIQLLNLLAQLGVDGRQLFVDRLHLLLGTLEFLIGRLQFLVQRQQLFMVAFLALAGRLPLLDHGLQLALGGLQFRLQLLHGELFGKGSRPFRQVLAFGRLEDDRQQARPLARLGHQAHDEVDGPRAAGSPHDHVLLDHGLSGPNCLANRRPQDHAQALASVIDDVEGGGRSGGQLKIGAGLPRSVDDLRLLVDHNAGRGIVPYDAFQKAADIRWLGLLRPFHRHGGKAHGFARHRQREDHRRWRPLHALEDPLVGVQFAEQPRTAADPLRRAQEQIPAGGQGVVKKRHQPLLQSGVHVDQQIAAGDQVQRGKRRVANHIVDREHAHLADLLVHLVNIALPDEKAFPPLR